MSYAGQCQYCPHPTHIGPCTGIHFYDRPGGPPGNQQCMCGHTRPVGTITMTPCQSCERLRIAVDQMEAAYKLAAAERYELLRERERLEIFIDAIRNAGLPDQWELDDPAMHYVTVQIEKDDWLMCRETLAAMARDKGGEETAK